jgi:hypothetical protein
VPRREVALELALCCPIRDSEFSEEMKQDRPLPKPGPRAGDRRARSRRRDALSQVVSARAGTHPSASSKPCTAIALRATGRRSRASADPLPGLYNFANLLRAWSVSAIARHVQSMLGIWPRADEHVLYLDPHLPDWLEWIEVHWLVVAGERVSLRFTRDTWQAIEAPRSLELRSGRQR